MSPSEELQGAILAALRADPGVLEIVDGRIVDGRPESAGGYPCVTFGPADFVSEDVECITGGIETLQIDCWARLTGSSSLHPTKRLCHAVKTALHKRDLVLGDHALIRLEVSGWRASLDPDGLTGHGVVTVEADLEEN